MSPVPVCYYRNTTLQSQTDVTANETSRQGRAERLSSVSGLTHVPPPPPRQQQAVSCYNRRVCARVRGNGGRRGPFYPLLCCCLLNRLASVLRPGPGAAEALFSGARLRSASLEIRNTRLDGFCRFTLALRRGDLHLCA